MPQRPYERLILVNSTPLKINLAHFIMLYFSKKLQPSLSQNPPPCLPGIRSRLGVGGRRCLL